MPREDTIHGTPVRFDCPVWQPLLELIGDYLINDFMWMAAIDLDNGSVIHAYKHSATRHYIYVHEDGRTLAWDGDDRYHVVRAREAIDTVFADWEYLIWDPDDRDEIRAALDAARERADERAAAEATD